MISAQKNTVFVNSHYEKIRKVYSIWIQMNVGKEKANTITEYSMSEKNIVGAVKEKESHYDLMTVIMIGLGSEQTADRPILRLLDVLLPVETKTLAIINFMISLMDNMNKKKKCLLFMEWNLHF